MDNYLEPNNREHWEADVRRSFSPDHRFYNNETSLRLNGEETFENPLYPQMLP